MHGDSHTSLPPPNPYRILPSCPITSPLYSSIVSAQCAFGLSTPTFPSPLANVHLTPGIFSRAELTVLGALLNLLVLAVDAALECAAVHGPKGKKTEGDVLQYMGEMESHLSFLAMATAAKRAAM
jgi:hypothetical protein